MCSKGVGNVSFTRPYQGLDARIGICGRAHVPKWLHLLISLFGNINCVDFNFFPHFLEAPGVPYSGVCEVAFSWRRGKKSLGKTSRTGALHVSSSHYATSCHEELGKVTPTPLHAHLSVHRGFLYGGSHAEIPVTIWPSAKEMESSARTSNDSK